MQTDRGIYHKRVCDRCGAVLGGRMMNPDEYFKDWAWRRDTGDLCPECYEEYKRVIGRFDRGKKRKEKMKDYRIYRCKRCGQEIIAKDIEVLRTGQLKRILSAESVTLFAFENSWIHHCQNNSIGVCELIGWEAEE